MTTASRTWRKPKAIANPWLRRGLYTSALAYLVFAIWSVELDLVRMAEGAQRATSLFAGVLAPDFVTRWDDIFIGLVESLTMTVVATVVGVALSLPLALGASRNLAPPLVYYLCRSILAISRAFHEIIIAILAVAMFGFGPLAGLVTLIISTVGFLGKLFAEDMEAIDETAHEAIISVGASWPTRIVYGVLPQVYPRFVGLTLYRLDINFRESAVIGIVGAGGIGATLTTAFDRYEFDSVAAILIIIIAMVLLAEYVASAIRKRVM